MRGDKALSRGIKEGGVKERRALRGRKGPEPLKKDERDYVRPQKLLLTVRRDKANCVKEKKEKKKKNTNKTSNANFITSEEKTL